MTKADIVSKISEKTGIEKLTVQTTVEEFMKTVRKSLEEGVFKRFWFFRS